MGFVLPLSDNLGVVGVAIEAPTDQTGTGSACFAPFVGVFHSDAEFRYIVEIVGRCVFVTIPRGGSVLEAGTKKTFSVSIGFALAALFPAGGGHSLHLHLSTIRATEAGDVVEPTLAVKVGVLGLAEVG